MEDNQIINGDPLKDLYTQFNPKLKLANSYEEFKSVMQDAGARKDFFNEFNSKLKLANDFNQFEDVLGLKKKDGGIPSPTGLPASLPSQLPKSSVTGGLISYADDGQKAAVVQPVTVTEKLFGNVRPERQQLDVTPKVRNVEKEIETEQVGKQITSDAIKNTLKAYKDRLSGDGTYNISDTDPALINQKNDLEKDLKEGNLQVVKSKKTGQYILARKNDSIDSISQAYNNVKDKQAEDRFVANLSTIDKIKHYENKKALVKDEYLPSEPSGFGGAFGTLIGENITPLAELAAATTVVGKYGKYVGLAGDALASAKKFTSFLTFATDAGYSGYANNTEKVYNALRAQNPNGDKVSQMQHAERAGLVGEVSGLAGAGAMTGAFARLNTAAKNVNVQPLVSSLEQLAHHTVKESATQGAFAAGGSILSDLGAISQGVKMKPSEIAAGAAESAKGIAEFTAVMGSAMGIAASSAKGIAEFTTVMGSAMGIAAGFANVPKYVKAQATGILAKLDPVLVNDAYKEAEASGAAPIGTAEKAMQQINGFKEAQKKVPTDLPDENVNAISGIQQKIDKLEAQKKTLAPQFHDRIDAVIDSLRNRSKEIASSDKPLEKEVDDITQQPTNVKIESAVAEEAPIEAKPIEAKPTKEVYDRNDTPIKIDDIGEGFVLHRGGKGVLDKGFHSIDKIGAEGYAGDEGKLTSSTIKKDAKILKLVSGDSENYSDNAKDIDEFYRIIGEKERKKASEWATGENPSDITTRLWNNKSAQEKLKKAGIDIVIGNTIDGVDAFVVNENALEKQIPKLEETTPAINEEVVKPLEGVAYHGDTGKQESSGYTYLGDKELAEAYAEENGGEVKEVKYKLEKPFVVDSDAKSKVIADLTEEFQKNNPKSKWHPDTTNYINKKLKEMGYDGLVIKKEALDSEYGYEKIGGTYGDSQIVLFPKEEVKPTEVKETIKTKENAIQEPSTSSVLQHPQEGARETRGERGRVEPSKQGKAIAEKGKQVKVNEKEIKTVDAERAEAKKLHGLVKNMDVPADADSIALRYLAEGGKVSQDAINEIAGTVKRARLNTGARELKTSEAKARTYAGGNETLDGLAHRLWENNGQEIPIEDIKQSLMDAINSHNTRLEASKSYLERYSPEYQEQQHWDRIAEERETEFQAKQADLEKELRNPLDEQIEGEASEEHINNLIKQYEAEFKAENQQPTPEGEGEVTEKVSGREGSKPIEEKGLAKDYQEIESIKSEKVKEKAKEKLINDNFNNIVDQLISNNKIKRVC